MGGTGLSGNARSGESAAKIEIVSGRLRDVARGLLKLPGVTQKESVERRFLSRRSGFPFCFQTFFPLNRKGGDFRGGFLSHFRFSF